MKFTRAGVSVIVLSWAVLFLSIGLKGVEPAHEAIELRFSPHGGCQEEAIKQIESAKKTIHVRAYGFTSVPIGNALCEAAKRGVVVRAILDRSEKFSPHSMSATCQAAGCEIVFDASHPISHSKVIVIDSKVSLFGSYNWTGNAEKNAETMATVRDPRIAKELIADFDKHHEHSHGRDE